jgi:hypothetical protein
MHFTRIISAAGFLLFLSQILGCDNNQKVDTRKQLEQSIDQSFREAQGKMKQASDEREEQRLQDKITEYNMTINNNENAAHSAAVSIANIYLHRHDDANYRLWNDRAKATSLGSQLRRIQ